MKNIPEKEFRKFILKRWTNSNMQTKSINLEKRTIKRIDGLRGKHSRSAVVDYILQKELDLE